MPLLPFTTNATKASVVVTTDVVVLVLVLEDPTLVNDTQSFISPTMHTTLCGSCLYLIIKLKAALTVQGYSSFPLRKLFSSSSMQQLYQFGQSLEDMQQPGIIPFL